LAITKKKKAIKPLKRAIEKDTGRWIEVSEI
jgi:hypothetical protein